jgi:FHA domain-containing protein
MVLPDPDRHISRVHASVAFRNGQYIIMDQGSANPIHLNGRALGNGVQAPLADGDQLRIGDYVLSVSVSDAAAKAAEALFGEPLPVQAPPSMGRPVDDPLALFGDGGVSSADPFAGLGGASSAPSPPQAATSTGADRIPARTPAPGGIPDDFDPFGEQFGAKPLAAEPGPAKLPDDLDLGLVPQPEGEQSIDALFGLGPAGANSPDLFGPGSALGEQPSQPNTAAATDPFASLGLPQQAAPAPVSDHVPELHGSFTPPLAVPEAVPWDKAGPSEGAMFLSWTGAEPEKAVAPDARTAAGRSHASVTQPPRAVPGGVPGAGAEPPVQRPAAQPVQGMPPPATAGMPAPAVARAGDDELLRALLRGLGMPGLQLPHGLAPETMQLIGLLLREAVQGTLDLLLARAMTKREIRAEVTMIVGRDNNPLKFSPDAAVALTHLLASEGRGFMPPAAAIRDAYDDLRAHTFGFMAGMRAALAGVLERFDPAALEARLTEKSVLDSLLPMNRRARLWDLFAERYKDISREVEDDFHALFGKAFLKAYEEQVARLQDGADGR